MSHVNNYLTLLKDRGNPQLAFAVETTIKAVAPKYIKNFSYMEHVVSLLFGNVQSGKTSHMYGIMSAAADEGFSIFVVLTTDSTRLQKQTLERAQKDFPSFCVCDESDYLKFSGNNLLKPAIIVLKKNGRVLKQWKNNFSSTNFCAGNPLFIVDDEADAASLNTLVNKRRQSTINKTLEEIKNTSSSSIYLQVTGTPQSVLLQTAGSGWKPYFVHYFEPGPGYLGGDFFFSSENPYCILTDNEEAQDILSDDEIPENKLKTAVLTHLVTSAQIFLSGIDNVSNFLIHPSVRVLDHNIYAGKVGEYLNELSSTIDDDLCKEALLSAYAGLSETYSKFVPFDEVLNFIKEKLDNDEISVLVLNSFSNYEENNSYDTGINIIIGGNSLGRGVTFKKLQTVYYCRQAKNPQADTMWQHSRMFGYDRIVDLMRVFMPPVLFKRFTEINMTNNSLISQIQDYKNGSNIMIFYPADIRPTRKNVIDNNELLALAGGVNYFPSYPANKSIAVLDGMLNQFNNTDVYSVSLKMIVALINQFDTDLSDWNRRAFATVIESFSTRSPLLQGKLIVRRERDIAKDTGTLLSPNDRALGQSFSDAVVLTLYKVTGNKGWNGEKLWIPNIKFPDKIVIYDIK